jgi:hypothetical protein
MAGVCSLTISVLLDAECRSHGDVIGGIHSATSPWKENRMYPSKLGTMVAILATAAGFSALAGSAEAQISGTIGGDVFDKDAPQVRGLGTAYEAPDGTPVPKDYLNLHDDYVTILGSWTTRSYRFIDAEPNDVPRLPPALLAVTVQ